MLLGYKFCSANFYFYLSIYIANDVLRVFIISCTGILGE